MGVVQSLTEPERPNIYLHGVFLHVLDAHSVHESLIKTEACVFI